MALFLRTCEDPYVWYDLVLGSACSFTAATRLRRNCAKARDEENGSNNNDTGRLVQGDSTKRGEEVRWWLLLLLGGREGGACV